MMMMPSRCARQSTSRIVSHFSSHRAEWLPGPEWLPPLWPPRTDHRGTEGKPGSKLRDQREPLRASDLLSELLRLLWPERALSSTRLSPGNVIADKLRASSKWGPSKERREQAPQRKDTDHFPDQIMLDLERSYGALV